MLLRSWFYHYLSVLLLPVWSACDGDIDVYRISPQLDFAWNRLGIDDRLAYLLQLPAAEPLFAQFVHHVFEIFRSVPVYIPPLSLCTDLPGGDI